VLFLADGLIVNEVSGSFTVTDVAAAMTEVQS
jgi:hypothetical protein